MLLYSPNKRGFRGPGGVGRGQDSLTRPNSVRRNWPLLSPVVSRGPPWASRGLPWPPVDDGTGNIYIYIVLKFQTRHWDQYSNVPEYRQ